MNIYVKGIYVCKGGKVYNLYICKILYIIIITYVYYITCYISIYIICYYVLYIYVCVCDAVPQQICYPKKAHHPTLPSMNASIL